MKVLYLFSGVRGELIEKVEKEGGSETGLWGLAELRRMDVGADVAELEQWFAPKVARFLRFKVFGVYGAHLPFLLRFFRYNVIYTAGAFTTQFVFTALKTMFRFKKPLWVMQDFSIMGLLGAEKTLRQKMFAWMVARADGIVTTGLQEKLWLEERFPHLKEKITFIPFGVSTSHFSPQPPPTEPCVVSVGVDPDRDWQNFFKACEGLEAKVFVAGSPRRLRSYEPPSFVESAFVPDIRDAYARASVVVIPLDTSSGVNDAMGCSTLFEAMAMGKPVVVSRTHVTESYIKEGENGFLVHQKDSRAIRAAIEKLLHNPELRTRMGNAARAYAIEHLDLEKNTRALADFFKKLLDAR